MMFFVADRSGALVGEASDGVNELIVDPGVVPNFLLMVLWSCFLSLFSRDWGSNIVWVIWGSYNGFRFVSVDFCCHLP